MGGAVKKGAADRSGALGGVPVDEWPEGLNIGFKSLSARSVGRARQASEVVEICASHNLRQSNKGHRHRSRIDPARTPLNSVLVGERSPDAVAAEAAGVLAGLGLSYADRADAVAAFEVAVQPPSGWDVPEFWRAVLEWVEGRFEYVISAVVHRDQRRPHAHFLALPVLGGRMAGRDMQRGDFGFPIMVRDFRQHMRAALGLRVDRPDAITRLALTAGRGPKTHAAAARRDAALMRGHGGPAVGMDIDGYGHSTRLGRSMSMPAMSRIAQPLCERNGVAYSRDFEWMMGL